MISGTIPRISTRFILISTLQNENIGSSARALKTMGFDRLFLVNSRDEKVLQCKRTKNRASGADDVLKNTKICADVEEATEGCEIICGTGMPIDMHRKRRERPYVEPRVYFERIMGNILLNSNTVEGVEQQKQFDIAFLFGSETTGMLEDDMDKCDVMLGIPTNPKFGSLNLASAVQIIAYDWRMAMGGSECYG